ncbi:MAG: hypothetical protein EAY81_05135 [Bacteroidetes bacterium]|nr:MAG: hypothetical protein EAY81_05135 [Bacteroidota bacterium]
MNTIIRNSLFLLAASAIFSACKDDDTKPETPAKPGNPVEVITTVKLELEDPSGKVTTATWKDADGDGPGAPVISGLTLSTGQHYDGVVYLLDESKTPTDSISNQIEEKEKEAHQFFYTISGGAASRVTVEKEDKDANNLPVGLKIHVDVSPGMAATGTFKLVLKHYDGINKSADVTVGETDVEAEFPLTLTP